MDVGCQKSGEWGAALECRGDQYWRGECMTLHMHEMNSFIC